MLNDFRKIDIRWNKASGKIHDLIRTSSSDENGRKLVVQVLDNGSTVNLEDTELRLYWETKNKHYIGFDRFELADAENGIFELAFSTGMLSNIGTLKANMHLMNIEDETVIVTSEPFNIEVFEGIDSESIEATNSFTALTDALVRLTRIEESEETRKENEVVRNESESERKQSESSRASAESERVAAENSRQSQESNRESAESTREENETTRKQNESNRESAEQDRVETFETNELNRKSTFEQNENNRQSEFDENEGSRESAEQSREDMFKENESNRQDEFEENERTRQQDEQIRQDNENTRESNEESRSSTFESLRQAMEAVEQDYSDRAEDLEQTYSPRLLDVEDELDDDIQPRLSDLEAGNFDNRITITTDSMAEDSIFLRLMRADNTLLGWLSTGPDGTGLKIHMADKSGIWSGYVQIDEDGTIRQNGVPVATQ